MNKVRIGDLIQRHKELIKVEDNVTYKQVTIRVKHKGVVLRGAQQGSAIGTKNQYVARQGQFILSRIDARQGAFGVVPPELEGAIVTNDFWCFEINEQRVLRDFFYTLIQAPDFDEACKKASIGTTNRQRINEDFFLNYELEIPPLADQRVAVQQIAASRQHLGLIDAEIAHQTNLLARMRQAVLREAVQGCLVPQDAIDEPASALLARIRVEKQRLVKEKKLRADKPLPPLSEMDVPYKVPQEWVWCRLGDVLRYDAAQNTEPNPNLAEQWLLELEDIEKDSSVLIKKVKFAERPAKSIKGHFYQNDVLYGKLRPYLNKVIIADAEGYCTTEIVALRPYLDLLPEYILCVLKSSAFLSYVNSKSYGMKMPRLGSYDAIMAAFPLPPLYEQRRIITKVAELMAHCAKLEAELHRARQAAEALHVAALREAFRVPATQLA